MPKKSIASFTTIASWTRKLSLSIALLGSIATPSFAGIEEVIVVGRPQVNDDRVTVRVRVQGNGQRPIASLLPEDFRLRVEGEEVAFRSRDWRSPAETVPPPAWVVILLDMSGSMARDDARGTSKLQGAVSAIREFTELAADRGGDTQVAIVPFGEPSPPGAPGVPCPGYQVDNDAIDKFFPASDFKLQNHLDTLAETPPCASTNLYQPLNRTVRFLANPDDDRFALGDDLEADNTREPRLAIVLLSDGYHNRPNEQQDFDTLKSLLQRNDQIAVHTLGYGFTPEQLGEIYNLGRPATRQDVGTDPGDIPEAEFVDRDRLAEIASLTGGIAEFSQDSLAVAAKLRLFLDALLGEYEITYTDPNPERGAKHDVVVEVRSPNDGEWYDSDAKSYTITVFGRSLSRPTRALLALFVLISLGLGGVVPFWLWGKALKQQAET